MLVWAPSVSVLPLASLVTVLAEAVPIVRLVSQFAAS
jgi:hypothetical protein